MTDHARARLFVRVYGAKRGEQAVLGLKFRVRKEYHEISSSSRPKLFGIAVGLYRALSVYKCPKMALSVGI